MLKIDSKSTDLKLFIHIPHAYGVSIVGLHIRGCFFIVIIVIYSRYHAIFPVGAGTVSTRRIRVSIRVSIQAAASLILSLLIAHKLLFNHAYCTEQCVRRPYYSIRE
jgi:hypothetical protein